MHGVGPVAKRMSSFLGSTAAYCLGVPAGCMNSAENAVSFGSITVPELCCEDELFGQLASKAKERPCFAKWATNANSYRIPVSDFVAAVTWRRTKD